MELRTNGPTLSTINRMADKPLPAAAAQPAASAELAPAATSTAQAVQQPDAAPPQAKLDEALKSINKSMQALSQEIEFSIDPDTDRTVVKVVDQRTKEVIRQMPSAETLEIAKALDRLQGLLIRQEA
ncbi:flagellar protein FlaG [Massilia agilis]|uniref:Flagellar protein FlaG n=1 Tax=Massilia agilis TaxID=1811226 RepID=A0ABT2D8A3_9BURK|nr:flagellar protein FlaG [Massilia agilis]MCS0807377.1 flagellar protein FlaG [Massilia agilis]